MAIVFVTIYILDIRERSFLTVSYRTTALTKALVKVINDDEIVQGKGGRGGVSGKVVDVEAAIQPRTPLQGLY